MTGSRPRVLITGASGYIGQNATDGFVARDFEVSAVVRRRTEIGNFPRAHVIETIVDFPAWGEVFKDVDIVVHLAGRAHRRAEVQAQQIDTYRAVNVTATRDAAHSAARAGVRRFIYLSSIAVNGSTTDGREPFRANEKPSPVTPYGLTKLEAEIALEKVHTANAAMAIDIVRCPVVVGRKPPGNLAILEASLRKRLPLPFASIDNRRAFLAMEDLVSFLVRRARTPGTELRRFNLASDDTISTPDFVRTMASAMNLTPIMLPFPTSALRVLLTRLHRKDKADALLSSLEIDTTEALETGWKPELTIPEAIRRSFGVRR
jgi:UDP-glucose 4-epimerase